MDSRETTWSKEVNMSTRRLSELKEYSYRKEGLFIYKVMDLVGKQSVYCLARAYFTSFERRGNDDDEPDYSEIGREISEKLECNSPYELGETLAEQKVNEFLFGLPEGMPQIQRSPRPFIRKALTDSQIIQFYNGLEEKLVCMNSNQV